MDGGSVNAKLFGFVDVNTFHRRILNVTVNVKKKKPSATSCS